MLQLQIQSIRLSDELNFVTWDRPWRLSALDIRPFIINWWIANHNQRVTVTKLFGNYEMRLDKESPWLLQMEDTNHTPIVVRADHHFAFSNEGSYLEYALISCVSRQTLFEMDDTGFIIKPLSNEGEHVLYWENSVMPVSDRDAKRVCKPGTENTCLFLTASTRGFECAKFSGGIARMLLNRKAEGSIRATRLGSCINGGFRK